MALNMNHNVIYSLVWICFLWCSIHIQLSVVNHTFEYNQRTVSTIVQRRVNATLRLWLYGRRPRNIIPRASIRQCMTFEINACVSCYSIGCAGEVAVYLSVNRVANQSLQPSHTHHHVHTNKLKRVSVFLSNIISPLKNA